MAFSCPSCPRPLRGALGQIMKYRLGRVRMALAGSLFYWAILHRST